MIENLKLSIMLYLLVNLMMIAKGMDEATWVLSTPCKEPRSLLIKVLPGYSLGCALGEEE